MAKHILVYKGPATPMENITPEVGAQLRQEWEAWMGKAGDALVDAGAPFAGRTGVAGDGSTTSASDLTGYTIVQAPTIEEAKALCDGHPSLSDGTARFVVEICELAPR